MKFPRIRGALAEAWRAARAVHPDPVDAWGRWSAIRRSAPAGSGRAARAASGARPGTRRVEIVAASILHTVKTRGPGPGDRVLAHPRDVDAVLRRGLALPAAPRWREPVVLRLVLRPAGTSPPRSGASRPTSPRAPTGSTRSTSSRWGRTPTSPARRRRTSSPRRATRGRSWWCVADLSTTSKHADCGSRSTPPDGAFWMAATHVILRDFHAAGRAPKFLDYPRATRRVPRRARRETTPSSPSGPQGLEARSGRSTSRTPPSSTSCGTRRGAPRAARRSASAGSRRRARNSR